MEEVRLGANCADVEKHIRTLSHYLEKYHSATGYQNKEVAEILGMDKSYYNKIRLKKFSPITNSIAILKKFASLNSQSLINFIAEIEETPIDIKEKDWLVILEKAFTDAGPILRRALIHNRLKSLVEKDDRSVDQLLKVFLIFCLFIDLSKKDKWFDYLFDSITKLYLNIEGDKDHDIKILLERLKKIYEIRT